MCHRSITSVLALESGGLRFPVKILSFESMRQVYRQLPRPIRRRCARDSLLIPISECTQSFIVCTFWEVHITHNSLQPVLPVQCQENIIEKKQKALKESLMKESMLPLLPSLNTKPFPFVIVPKCTNCSQRVRNQSQLLSEDFSPKLSL